MVGLIVGGFWQCFVWPCGRQLLVLDLSKVFYDFQGLHWVSIVSIVL